MDTTLLKMYFGIMWFVRKRLHRFVRLTFRPPWKR